MRKFLAGLLGMVLCVQTVYGIPVRAADVFEPGERPKAMQDVIRQEDPEQTNRDNSGNLTGLELSAECCCIFSFKIKYQRINTVIHTKRQSCHTLLRKTSERNRHLIILPLVFSCF